MFPLSRPNQSTPMRLVLIFVFVMGAYLLQDNFRRWPYDLLKPFIATGWPRIGVYGMFTYGVWMVLLPIAVAAFVAGPRRWASAIGLDGSIWTAAKIGLISTTVLPITYVFLAPVSSVNIPHEIVLSAIFPGIGEEIFFRGMMFGLLFRFARWGFLPAALLVAIIFGVEHLCQGNSALEFLGIFGITAVAAVWWSWMYIEWDNNIWVPAALHILMNGYFNIFDVSDSALGSWSFFFIRGVVVLISVGLTIRHAKKRGHFRITYRNWFWRADRAEAV